MNGALFFLSRDARARPAVRLPHQHLPGAARDRWSLLVVRDLMVRGFRTFKDFEASGEGIASNILADRLQRLQTAGIVTAEAEVAGPIFALGGSLFEAGLPPAARSSIAVPTSCSSRRGCPGSTSTRPS